MRLTQLTKVTAVAGALVAPLAVAVPATQASTVTSSPVTSSPVTSSPGPASSAYGIAADGLVTLPPLPAVASSGRPARESVAELPANPLLRASVLSVAAEPGRAKASVAGLRARRLGLSARLITARCEDGEGSSHLAKVALNGHPLDATASPNTALTIGLDNLGAASVVLNKQVRDSRGHLTVTALELTVALGPGRVQTISIASASCGPVDGPDEAPAPTPVPGDLPVTG